MFARTHLGDFVGVCAISVLNQRAQFVDSTVVVIGMIESVRNRISLCQISVTMAGSCRHHWSQQVSFDRSMISTRRSQREMDCDISCWHARLSGSVWVVA